MINTNHWAGSRKGINIMSKKDLKGIQNEAQYTRISELYALTDYVSNYTVDDVIKDLYFSFLDEADELEVYSFDIGTLPFDVTDDSLETVDADSETVEDLLQLVKVAKKMEDEHKMPNYVDCISGKTIRVLTEILYQAFDHMNGSTDDKPAWYHSLSIKVKNFLDIYKERLANKYENNGQHDEYIFRAHDADTMIRWILGTDDREFINTALEQWPIVNILELLLNLAKENELGRTTSKNPQYIYEYLMGIIFNAFGEFMEI